MKRRNPFRYTVILLIICLSTGFIFKNRLQSETNEAGISLEANPSGIAINPHMNTAVIANEKSDSVSIVDLHAETVLSSIYIGRLPRGVAIDSELHIALIGNSRDDTVSIIDLNTYNVFATVHVGKQPEGIAINPVKNTALIANHKDNTVSVIDLTSLSITCNINVGKEPKDVAIDPELNVALVINEKDYTVSVIDLNTYQEKGILSIGKKLQAIDLNPETHLAAVVNEKDNSITVIDFQTYETYTISTGKHPIEIAINPLDNHALVICDEDRSLLLIDLDTRTIIKEYTLNKLPRGVAVNNFTNIAAVVDDKTDSLMLIQLPNPIPEITSIAPDSTGRAGDELSLTIKGKKFIASSVAYLGAESLITTFIDNNQIQATIPIEMLSNAGIFPITVHNPQPEGGASNNVDFTVINPVPSISSLDPAETMAGTESLELDIYGFGFFNDTEIYFGSVKKPTDHINNTNLRIELISEELDIPGKYEIMAYNSPPGGWSSNKVIFKIKSPLEITIKSPSGGDTINKSKVMVEGTVTSDTHDIGITVNGIVADILGNEWIANNVPLVSGEKIVTATVRDSYGNTDTETITIYTDDTTQHVELSANITSGIPPLKIHFSESTSFVPASYQMDFEGDGISDFTGTAFEEVSYTYSSEGIFYPTLIVIDDLGDTYFDTIAVIVLSNTEMDTLLKDKWEEMKVALVKQDIDGALKYYLEGSQQLYTDIYTAFFDQLPQLFQNMEDIQLIYVKSNTAKYRLRVSESYGGEMETFTYYIYFVLDKDGLWKIYQY
jgi:YVTN family beta-propeller protein